MCVDHFPIVQMGRGRGNTRQAGQVAIIFNLALSGIQVEEPVLLYTEFFHFKSREASGGLPWPACYPSHWGNSQVFTRQLPGPEHSALSQLMYQVHLNVASQQPSRWGLLPLITEEDTDIPEK